MSDAIQFFHQLKKLRGAWPCVGCPCFTSRNGHIEIKGCPWLADQVIPSIKLASSWEYLDRDVLEVVLQCERADPERIKYVRALWLEERPFYYETTVKARKMHGMPCKDIGNGWVQLM